MELKRRFDFRRAFWVFYFTALVIYLIIGLAPAGASTPVISAGLVIPSIHLASGVTDVPLVEHKLDTPDEIVGSYQPTDNKTFLIGHSTTAFKNLKNIQIGDYIYYSGLKYQVVKTQLQAKSDVDMKAILADTDIKTVVMMTCAGELLDGGDATHRFVVTAVLN